MVLSSLPCGVSLPSAPGKPLLNRTRGCSRFPDVKRVRAHCLSPDCPAQQHFIELSQAPDDGITAQPREIVAAADRRIMHQQLMDRIAVARSRPSHETLDLASNGGVSVFLAHLMNRHFAYFSELTCSSTQVTSIAFTASWIPMDNRWMDCGYFLAILSVFFSPVLFSVMCSSSKCTISLL